MNKKLFNKTQREKLAKNKYVKKSSEKYITYTSDFKKLFIKKAQMVNYHKSSLKKLVLMLMY